VPHVGYDTLIEMKGSEKNNLSGKKIQAKNAAQRSRGKYLKKPPEKLEYLIEIVNCLPPDGLDLRFMNPEALKANVEAEASLEGKTKKEYILDGLDVAACESTKQLPSQLRDYVWRGEWKGESFHVTQSVHISIPLLPGSFRRYAEVWDAYEKLHGIVKATKNLGLRWNLLKLGRHASISSVVQIDRDGMLRERKSLFSKVIEGQNIEAARIRECPVCLRIFWAGRIDAGQCGRSKCKSALSSRLNRDPERRILYNKARRGKRIKHNSAEARTRTKGK
jgi:hypothetical protein